MAAKLTWSERADRELHDILWYWENRNRSPAYSIKLYGLINDRLGQVCNFSHSGNITATQGVRSVIVRDYRILYELRPDEIYILAIFDTRQNPEKLRDISEGNL
jgi:plasmid stabilization system protein ParE